MSEKAEGQSNRTQPGGPEADPLGLMKQFSTTSAEVMSAWTEAWGAMLSNRGAPVGQAMMRGMGNPVAWPSALAPVLDEIRSAFKLPKFADLPGLDLFQLPSPVPLLNLLQLSQEYASVSIPVWTKASERFQAEVAKKRTAGNGETPGAGELMDVWNNVLDLTLMEFNRSGEFASAQQRLLHAAVQQRRELSGAVEKFAKSFDMPTRTEMTDVYQRLHDLVREVHALRREVRTLRKTAATAAPSEPALPAPAEPTN